MTDDVVEIPPQRLSSELLEALLDEFILREGTDYGETEYTLAQKREQLLAMLRSRHIRIYYDSATESCSLRRAD